MSRKIKKILRSKSGRGLGGTISVRHQGGAHKRYLRLIDWRREKYGVPAKVMTVEFDPNRSAKITLLNYKDGEKRYIVAIEGLQVGDEVVSGPEAEIKIGNALPLGKIPLGTAVHCLEIKPGKGAQLVRGAGGAAYIMSRQSGLVTMKLPSGEIRLFSEECLATIGQIGNITWKDRVIGKAGRNIRLGIRPTVRGVAMNPHSHPHGGGEGRSGIGMPSPVSPWGKKTLGKKTRRPKKYSDRIIVKRIN